MQKFKTYQLALKFYRNSQKLHLCSPLKDQFKRAASSIVLNLAEGSAKPTARDRKKFYYISLRYNSNDSLNIVLRNEDILLTKMHRAF